MLLCEASLTGLNEVQFPNELQPQADQDHDLPGPRASMKCSSQRNCNTPCGLDRAPPSSGLNEVQFPKELQREHLRQGRLDGPKASMKCSSQRNCNPASSPCGTPSARLNEVQFPKELQLGRRAYQWV